MILFWQKTKIEFFKLEHLPPLGAIIHAHHVLKFSYSTEGSESPKKVEKMRFNYIKGNYVEISDSMSWVDWEKEFKDLNTNEQYELWVKIYSDLCNKNIPKIKVNQARRKPPWLNNEIKLLIKKRTLNGKKKRIEQIQKKRKKNSICWTKNDRKR